MLSKVWDLSLLGSLLGFGGSVIPGNTMFTKTRLVSRKNKTKSTNLFKIM